MCAQVSRRVVTNNNTYELRGFRVGRGSGGGVRRSSSSGEMDCRARACEYTYTSASARARIHALRGRRTWWHARPDRVAAAATPLTGRHATRRRRVGHVFVRQHQTHKYTHDFIHKTPHDDVNFFSCTRRKPASCNNNNNNNAINTAV